MIRLEHIALWVGNLEEMKTFYIRYFQAKASDLYHNPGKDFYSYFLSFTEGCRLELMYMPIIPDNQNDIFKQYKGLIHFAISVGSVAQVDQLTNRLRADGYIIAGEPRTTGDGYYESVVLDPEYNRIEITA